MVQGWWTCKKSKSEKTLDEVNFGFFDLLQSFNNNPGVVTMHSYKLISRVLQEQYAVTAVSDGTTPEVSLKPPKVIPNDSLQNLSDPDAIYDGHKGQVMETYSMKGIRKPGAKPLI